MPEKFSASEPVGEPVPETEISEEPDENPNSIGDLGFSLGKDLLTTPDNVYRSVRDEAALHDLNEHGAVRNAQSAGVRPQSRWGNRVFWSRGSEGKYHIVGKDAYVIVAPHEVAATGPVGKEHVSSIFTKNEEGAVEDVKGRFLSTGSEEDRATALEQMRDELATGTPEGAD